MSNSTVGILNVREAAEQRRSIRAYEPGPVPREDLNEILDVVRRAPSAWNVQPWRFVIVESPEVKAQVAQAAYNQPQVTAAPALIVLYTDMKNALEHLDEVMHPGMGEAQREQTSNSVLGVFAARSEADREAWGAEQGNIALGYLLLAAEAHGYQTSPMLGFDPAALKAALGLPEHVRIPALVAIGKGAEEGFPQHRHELDRIVRAA